MIQSVDAATGTITIERGKTVSTYKADKFTKVTINGKDAKLEELSSGLAVSVNESGGGRVSRIDAQDAPDRPEATAQKKGKKK